MVGKLGTNSILIAGVEVAGSPLNGFLSWLQESLTTFRALLLELLIENQGMEYIGIV